MNTPLLKVDNLDVIYPGGRGRKPFHALKSVSLDIQPGETVGLVGNPVPARRPWVERCWG